MHSNSNQNLDLSHDKAVRAKKSPRPVLLSRSKLLEACRQGREGGAEWVELEDAFFSSRLSTLCLMILTWSSAAGCLASICSGLVDMFTAQKSRSLRHHIALAQPQPCGGALLLPSLSPHSKVALIRIHLGFLSSSLSMP